MSDDLHGSKGKKAGPELEPRVYPPWNRPPTGKVLIVEPDLDVARALEVRLARDGHEVVLTDSGKAALEASRRTAFDVALIERRLSDMSGLDVIASLKAILDPFEALLLTGEPTIELYLDAIERGAYDLVAKPFPHLKPVTWKVKHAVAKVHAERDRTELARLLHAQTRDMAEREVEAEMRHHEEPEEEAPLGLDLDSMVGTDPLTGLANRRAADDRFRKETARALRYDRPLTVALASVDELETVIERFGREVADGVLRGIAQMFTGMIRDVDFLARREGGEFFFLFPETPKENGFIVLDRIRLKLAQTQFSETLQDHALGEFKLTASFGVAGLPTDTMNADILRDAAEAALARAKASGNRVVLFDNTMVRRS